MNTKTHPRKGNAKQLKPRQHMSFSVADLQFLCAVVPEQTVIGHRLATALLKLERRLDGVS